jgi:hypothetical protein
MRKDCISGAAFMILATAYYHFAQQIPRSKLSDAIGAAYFPKLLAICLFVLSALLVLAGALAKPPANVRKKVVDKPDSPSDLYMFRRAGGTLLIGISYLLLVPYTGYPIGVFLVVFWTLLYFHEPLSRKVISTAIGAGIFFWFLFVVLFKIPMPTGFLALFFS